MAYVGHLSDQEAEGGGWKDGGHSGLHSEGVKEKEGEEREGEREGEKEQTVVLFKNVR